MKMADKDIKRRTALCKALFMAPPEIFTYVNRYIEISINTYIERKTGQRPSKNFPLDFLPESYQATLPEDPTKLMDNLTDKDPAARAELCKVLFLAPASMFRDIERYYAVCLHSFIKEKTGKKPNAKYPLDLWIYKTPRN